MDKYSIFSFFFFNYFIVRLRAANVMEKIEQKYKISDNLTEIDFVKLALAVIGKKETDTNIDWKAAFAQFAPIGILALDNAASYELLLTIRSHIRFIEDNYCDKMPDNQDEFIKQIKTDDRFAQTGDEVLKGKKHFKMWIWMLVRGSDKFYAQMDHLRKLLDNDGQKFIWFADQIQGLFELISDDLNSLAFSPLYDLKHMKIGDIEKYIAILSPELKNAMKIFCISEGWIPS